MKDAAQTHEDGSLLPNKGDRVELFRTELGVRVRLCGTVYYSDHVQVLVKWDDGRSQSLRPEADRFRIIPQENP
jgi:hypothetical protein